jgi:hypothetical protein
MPTPPQKSDSVMKTFIIGLLIITAFALLVGLAATYLT